MLGTVYGTFLFVVACMVTGNPEGVALEAPIVPAAPGSPDFWSLLIKPSPLSHSSLGVVRGDCERQEKNFPHWCWHGFLLVFFCHLHGFLGNTVLRS